MVLKRYEKIILVAVLILTFFINGFYGHYKYPIHGDEYAHLAQAKDIIYKGKIEMTNPYLKSGIGHIRLENGFHVIGIQPNAYERGFHLIMLGKEI